MYSRILLAVDDSESTLGALKSGLSPEGSDKGETVAEPVVPPYNGELGLVRLKNVAATLRGPYEKALSESRLLLEMRRVGTETMCSFEKAILKWDRRYYG